MPATDFTTIRVPVWLDEEISLLARELEEYVSNASSQKQQENCRIIGGLHERFGVAKWKVVERLLHEHSLKRNRHQRYRTKRQQKSKSVS